MEQKRWDVIVIGGGPAGLSAALTLGRCRRSVLVCDAGRYRNRASQHMHCFLTRDGIAPAEFLRLAREELRQYSSVELRAAEVTHAACREGGFEVSLADGTLLRARKLLLATGVVDELPQVEGFQTFYGKSAHHCPYCDGWEWRDQPIAVYGRGEKGAGLALMMKQWSPDIAFFMDGVSDMPAGFRERFTAQQITVYEERIARLEGTEDGLLRRVVLASGKAIERRAFFFNTGQHQRSPLASLLGCDLTSKGGVEANEYDVTTNVPGVYVAGDASRDVQLVVVAAAEGTKAAFAINKALLAEAGLA
jgi:thioredoxin reductase